MGTNSHKKYRHMDLQDAFKKLDLLGLPHDKEIALIKLIGEFGRSEYTRGYKASSKIHSEY